jgi:hypothetical protein
MTLSAWVGRFALRPQGERGRDVSVSRRSAVVWLAVGAAACSVALTLPTAVNQALWQDEVASARIVTLPSVHAVVHRVRGRESSPPLWYALAWTVRTADGSATGGEAFGDVARLRLLSIAFNAVAVLLTVIWARRFLPAAGVCLVGAMMALGAAMITHAEELRAYSLLLLLAVVFAMLLVRTAERPSLPWAAALAAATAAGCLTHYFFAFTAAAGLVWLVALRGAWAGRRTAAVAVGIGALACTPWLPVFWHQVHHRAYAVIGSTSGPKVALAPAALVIGPAGLAFGLVRLGLTAALAAGVVVLWRRDDGRAVALLAVVPTAVTAMLWAAGQPVVDARNLMAIAPFVAIGAAAGICALPRPLAACAAVALGAAVIAGAVVETGYGRTAYGRMAAALVQQGWSPRAPVLVFGDGETGDIVTALGWYLPGHTELRRVGGTPGACTVSHVVAEGRAGRRWLADQGDLAGARSFRSYDHVGVGRPSGVVIVARLRRPVAWHSGLDGGDVYGVGTARDGRGVCRV